MSDKRAKKGLIVRRPCEQDRRVVYAELTEAGRKRMAEILPAHYQALAESFASLHPAEKEQAITLLKKISFSSHQ